MRACPQVILCVVLASGACSIQDLHDEAWTVREQAEEQLCASCYGPDGLETCLEFTFGWGSQAREAWRECELKLLDRRESRKAGRRYYECIIDVYDETGRCFEESQSCDPECWRMLGQEPSRTGIAYCAYPPQPNSRSGRGDEELVGLYQEVRACYVDATGAPEPEPNPDPGTGE